MSEPNGKPAKQPYTTPKLVTYGDITTLTQSTALSKPKLDGSAGRLKTRTS